MDNNCLEMGTLGGIRYVVTIPRVSGSPNREPRKSAHRIKMKIRLIFQIYRQHPMTMMLQTCVHLKPEVTGRTNRTPGSDI